MGRLSFSVAALAAAGLYLAFMVTDAYIEQKEGMTVNRSIGSNLTTPNRPPSPIFRLGSGAYWSIHGNASKTASQAASQDDLPRKLTEATKSNPGNLQTGVEWATTKHWSGIDVMKLSPVICIGLFCLMMPAGAPNLASGNVTMGNFREFNNRVPPGWSPEMESTYSFRAYITDITILDADDRPSTTTAVCSHHCTTWRSSSRTRAHDDPTTDHAWWCAQRHAC